MLVRNAKDCQKVCYKGKQSLQLRENVAFFPIVLLLCEWQVKPLRWKGVFTVTQACFATWVAGY